MNTKHIFFIIGLVLETFATSNAQSLNFGSFAGYDRVKIHQPKLKPGQRGTGFDPMNSYNINCFISYKSQGFLGFSLEPGYIIKGSGLGLNSKDEFKCFQFPLLAEVYILKKLNFSIGPEFSYMFSAKSINPSYVIDISDQYNKTFELSGFIGINYLIFRGIGIGIGYNHGITYIRKSPWGSISNPMEGSSNQYNQYLQIRISYRIHSFDLTKKKPLNDT